MNKKPTKELSRSILIVIFIILGVTCGIVYYSEVIPVEDPETESVPPVPEIPPPLSPQDIFEERSEQLKKFGIENLSNLTNLSDLEILKMILENDEAKTTISNLVDSYGIVVADTGISMGGTGSGTVGASFVCFRIEIYPLYMPDDEQVIIELCDSNVLKIETLDSETGDLCISHLDYLLFSQWRSLGGRKEYRDITNDEIHKLLEINVNFLKYDNRVFVGVERDDIIDRSEVHEIDYAILILHGFAWNETPHTIDGFKVCEGEYATIIYLSDAVESKIINHFSLIGEMLIIE